MSRLVLASLVVALTLGARSRPAVANAAAPPPPAEVTSLGSAGARTPLAVRSAALNIDCSNGASACGLEVTYELHNPTAAVAGGTAAFYALVTDDVAVTVDGAPAGRPLTADDVAGFDTAVGAASGVAVRDIADQDELRRHGFELSLAPGASAKVVVTGRLRPQARRDYHGYAVPATVARHRLLARGARVPRVHLQYLVAPIRTWGGFPDHMSLTLTHPAAWTATVEGATTAPQRDGDLIVSRGEVATAGNLLDIDLVLDPPIPLRAGVLLGLGGHVDNATGVRLRGGIEVGYRDAWLGSLAVELERGDDTGLVLVPAVAVGSPLLLIIPSFAVGVGAPVRLEPSLELGGRLQLDAQLGPIGMLVALDYYPGMVSDPRRFQVSLLGQLSL